MEKVAQASFDSELLVQRTDKPAQAEDEDKDNNNNPSSQHFNDNIYVPTGPTTPPRAGQSADVDMSATPKASCRKPTKLAQPQGSRPGPQPSGPSRADKGKQPVRTNPVAV